MCSALTRVFPVLLQVDAVAAPAATRNPKPSIPFVSGVKRSRPWRRCFAGSRAGGRSSSGSMTFSGPMLTAWCCSRSCSAPPSPPAMLTLLCFRSEEMAAKPFLQSLLDRARPREWSALSLDPMTEDEAQTFIGGLLPGDSTLTDQDKVQLTREAGGSPFVLEQLALHAGLTDRGTSRPPTFARDVRRATQSPFRRTRAASSKPWPSAAGR